MNRKVGYRFHPTDEELINHFLKNKVLGNDSEVEDDIAEVDICKWEPWELPKLAVNKLDDDPVWFFFCPRVYKKTNSNSQRENRATNAGYWKATGKDRKIWSEKGTKQEIGIKKTLVFYKGRSTNGARTNWVIHEYHPTAPDFPDQRDYVIRRLKRKQDETADNSTPDEGESSHQVPSAYRNISENTADEGESSHQMPFAIPENTSPEDKPELLPNLKPLVNNGWLDCDSPFALQSQMVMEPGQINQRLSVSSVDSSTNMPHQINCIYLASEQIPIHKSQYQSIGKYVDDIASADFTDPSWEPSFQEFTDTFYESMNPNYDDCDNIDFTDPGWEPNFQEFTDTFYESMNPNYDDYDSIDFDWEDEALQNLDNIMEG